jgi:hypothetical protein
MPENDFLPVAIGGTPNVQAQGDYAGSTPQVQGWATGAVPSAQEWNKMLRQASFVGSSLAQLMANVLSVDILDDGDQAAFIALLLSLLQSIASGAQRTIIAAGPQNILVTDQVVFIDQTVAAPITLNLPVSPAPNQEVTVFDSKGDGMANNITISGNGNNIKTPGGSLAQYKITVNYGAVTLVWNTTLEAWQLKSTNV